MKRFALAFCAGLGLASMPVLADAATLAAPRPGFVQRGGIARLPLRPYVVDGRATRGLPSGLGLRRRPRLPVFSPVIGKGYPEDGPAALTLVAGEEPDVDTLLEIAASLRADAAMPGTGGAIESMQGVHETYVGASGRPVVRGNPGPRIIYVSHKPSLRRPGGMPTIIRGISLSSE